MRVLIADDDRLVCEMIKQYVLLCGHEVVELVCGGGISVIQSYSRHVPDVLILDVLMPRLNGFTVCHNVLSRHPEAKIVLMSGQVERGNYSVAHSGAVAYMQKPFGLEELRAILTSLSTERIAEPAIEAAA